MPLQYGYATANSIGYMSPDDKKRTGAVMDAQADFGFVGDLVSTFDGDANTSGSSTINSQGSAKFVSNAIVGHRITLAGAGTAGAMYVGTITAVNSDNTVTVTPAIATSVSSKGMQFGTDNTAAIVAMQGFVNTAHAYNTAAAFPGVFIRFGESVTNAYGFPVTMSFNAPVAIEGIGGSANADVGDYTKTGGTRLAWWGSTVDGGVAFAPFISVTAAGILAVKKPRFKHLTVDCRNGDQNSALIGIKLSSCTSPVFEDVFINDASAIGLWMDVNGNPTEAGDTTRWSLQSMNFRQLDNPVGAVTNPIFMTSAVGLTTTGQALSVGPNTLPTSGYIWTMTNQGNPVLVNYTGGGGSTSLTGATTMIEVTGTVPTTVAQGNIVQAVPGNGCAMYLGGSNTHNTCCAQFLQGQINHGTTWGPAAVEFNNSDSIDMISLYINGGNNFNLGLINRVTKPGVRMNGSTVGATLASRNITFRGGSAGAGGVSNMGFTSAGVRLTAMAGPNYWDLYQMGNGEPIPNKEGDSFFEWNPNGGLRSGFTVAGAIADQSISAATLTSLTGSVIAIPPQGLQNGTTLRWTVVASSTAAAGTATNAFNIRYGSAGGANDASVAQFSTTVGTAAASEFKAEFDLTVRTTGSAATAAGNATIWNSAAAGFINASVNVLTGTMATFNTTTAQQFMNLTTTTGASKTLTIRQVSVVCVKNGNP